MPDAAIWAATGVGLQQAVAPEVPDARGRGLVQQWAGVAAYAANRPGDPTQARARELAELFAASQLARLAALAEADADTVLEAAGRLLGDSARQAAGLTVAEDVPPGLVAAVLARCLAWHDEDVAAAAPLLSVFTGHGTEAGEAPPSVDPDLVARLRRWLSDRVGAPVTVERAVTISGGFSRSMLDVTWSCGGKSTASPRSSVEPTRAVVRIEQGGMFASEGRREVAVMRAVADAGYPVPRVLWEEGDPAVLGEPFFVMAWVDGAARLDDEALDDVLRGVADLHALDRAVVDVVAAIDGLDSAVTAEEAIAAQLAHWHRVYRASTPHPVPLLERGFGWLDAHLRPTGPPVVVHGDPGPGNALHDGSGIAAVIDWEFAHAGDPAEDWAYLALIRGRRLMTPALWKERLRQTVDLHYDDETWNAWEVYNGVKGACVNLTALDVFTSSPRPTPDQLAIGVAVHLRFLGRVIDLTDARPTG